MTELDPAPSRPQAEPGLLRPPLEDLPALSPSPWQMSFGERAVIEGLVAQLKPRLALEIGTAEGGSLGRIAAHSERVISFDLVEPAPETMKTPNVEFRTGDSHVLLPLELERLEADGESVDFVLVDGDHSADGARRDMEDILASNAVGRAVLLAHDTLNQEVRRGLEEVPYADFDKVCFVDFDFVGGYVPANPPLRGQCWGGLGLVILDEAGDFRTAHEVGWSEMLPLPELVWPAADALREDREAGNMPGGVGMPPEDQREDGELAHYRRLAEELQTSLSWRVTAPLRAVSRRFRRHP